MKPKQNKKQGDAKNNYLPPAHQCLSSPWAMAPLANFSSSFYCWAWHHMVWNIMEYPFVQFALASLAVSSPSFLYTPSIFAGRAAWEPSLTVSTAQQQLKHQYVINTIITINPKYSSVPATMKKISYPRQNQHRNLLEYLL